MADRHLSGIEEPIEIRCPRLQVVESGDAREGPVGGDECLRSRSQGGGGEDPVECTELRMAFEQFEAGVEVIGIYWSEISGKLGCL
ncbi:MAG: hypothetical protein ACRDVM_05920 [Acidimicrobiia bacterium]